MKPDLPSLFDEQPYVARPTAWPAQGLPRPSQILVNGPTGTVREGVWAGLAASPRPLIATGYAGVDQLTRFVEQWSRAAHADGSVRVLLGSEPWDNGRARIGDARRRLTEEMREYWLGRGVSLSNARSILTTLNEIESRRVVVRSFSTPGVRFHAKGFSGSEEVAFGSANFTASGLSRNLELVARHPTSSPWGQRVNETLEWFWDRSADCTEEFAEQLRAMLSAVEWEEALARGVAEVLRGDWALAGIDTDLPFWSGLWDHQLAGVAEAMAIFMSTGGVVVADATGSGKTRTGIALAAQVRQWLAATGKARDSYITIVCPPTVTKEWERTAEEARVPVQVVSSGKLSRAFTGPLDAAHVVLFDEAHQFVNESLRTRRARAASAEYRIQLTATPISRSIADLGGMLQLFDADSLDESTTAAIAKALDHRRGPLDATEVGALRSAIRTVLVRRTKRELNRYVDIRPEGYTNPDPAVERACRYPDHKSLRYEVKASARTVEIRTRIGELAEQLKGIALLGETLMASPHALVPPARQRDQRLALARATASWHLAATLQSSPAAALQHVLGTKRASAHFDLPSGELNDSGDMVGSLDTKLSSGPPPSDLPALPSWLNDERGWVDACRFEEEIYRFIAELVKQLDLSREESKAVTLLEQAEAHGAVLAFDRRPISLVQVADLARARSSGVGIKVVVTTDALRGAVQDLAPGRIDPRPRIALCSDLASVGVNMQGASTLVHLDSPTTLRVAEQRVGRIDRMNTAHPAIRSLYPADHPAFETGADEKLRSRLVESRRLIGANLELPEGIDEVEGMAPTIDEIDDRIASGDWSPEAGRNLDDAFAPLRALIAGDDALVPARTYQSMWEVRATVLARVSIVRANRPWTWVTVAGTPVAPPLMVLFDDDGPPLTDPGGIAEMLRSLLSSDPPSLPIDDRAAAALDELATRLRSVERDLLPPLLARPLDAFEEICRTNARTARLDASPDEEVWEGFLELMRPDTDEGGADLEAMARWARSLLRPIRDQIAKVGRRRRTRWVRTTDVTARHLAEHFTAEQVADSFRRAEVPQRRHLDERVAAVIVGLPEEQ